MGEFSVADYIKSGTEAIVLIKTLYPLLPTQSRNEVEAKIAAAEEALQRANVELAKSWHYHLCHCTFPPQIMLWREKERGHFCTRPECGHNTVVPNDPLPRGPSGSSWTGSRRG